MGFHASSRRGHEDVQDKPDFCNWNDQDSNMDDTTRSGPARLVYCPKYKSARAFVWSGVWLWMYVVTFMMWLDFGTNASYRGIRVSKVSRTTRVGTEMDRGQVESTRPTSALCIRGSEDIW